MDNTEYVILSKFEDVEAKLSYLNTVVHDLQEQIEKIKTQTTQTS